MTPATKGTACEVPERDCVAVSDSLSADSMCAPGAQMCTHLPKLEATPGLIHKRSSFWLVAATVIASGSLQSSQTIVCIAGSSTLPLTACI